MINSLRAMNKSLKFVKFSELGPVSWKVISKRDQLCFFIYEMAVKGHPGVFMGNK